MAPRVGLLVTCLVDLVRPSVGFAAVRLLEGAGCEIDVPRQTCCGQPAYNSGDVLGAREIAWQVITAFRGFDYVVVPSGSCAAMLRCHYPRLFEADASRAGEAAAFAERVFELSVFLADVCQVTETRACYRGAVAYHDSCSGTRELGIADQPRRLLRAVEGLLLVELPDRETCCGFGGLFSIKYPEISAAIADKKVRAARAAGVPVVVGGDLGCLMHLAGRLSRLNSGISCRHFAEVLAGELSEPAIGAAVGDKPGSVS